MKKLLSIFVFFVFFLGFCGNVRAQVAKENPQPMQKIDDGVVFAYPNPTKNDIVVKVKDGALKIKSVSFYSILGTQVLYVSINANSSEINLERLKPGKYLMKYILSDNTSRIKQIIKQ